VVCENLLQQHSLISIPGATIPDMDCPVTGRRTGGCVHNVSDHPETAIDHGRPLQWIGFRENQGKS